jgi:hypothetical protein
MQHWKWSMKIAFATALLMGGVSGCSMAGPGRPVGQLPVSQPPAAASPTFVPPLGYDPTKGPAAPVVGVAYPFRIYFDDCVSPLVEFGGRLWRRTISVEDARRVVGAAGPVSDPVSHLIPVTATLASSTRLNITVVGAGPAANLDYVLASRNDPPVRLCL